ncbi:phosphomannomutase/phosphoglucomutase [Lysobacter sp. A6]|uniref:phosphomannomutase n=1 Tax=Noviluteimonas lactosilytica TaxID=2888523 RepID=A0ABS8JI05_9GAMM|nr:phosphomannomutase/phosphoglucomutase [Lysobacter lactosilyticus]MCC8363243.1 phosphomannomutase/phosphoglucomutase [Lysobacter lactosilyticus]
MTEHETAAPKAGKFGGAGALKPAMPVIAVVCALLALWLAWSGWVQFQAERREAALKNVRDQIATQVADAVGKEVAQLDARLKSAPVQAALAQGDLAAAGAAIKQGWAGAQDAQILVEGLDPQYAALAQGGFGKVGLAESAVSENKAVAAIVKDAGGARLAIAAPAHNGPVRVGVAYVRLPLERATAAVQGGDVSDDSYLALRQGSFSVVERGDAELATGAEVLAVPVKGTQWRLAAGLPDAGKAPFGLGAIPCWAAAAVLFLLGFGAWRASRGPRVVVEAAHADAPTLAQSVQTHAVAAPVAEAPKVRPVTEPAAPAGNVLIDKSIFRAYDIRGVVGKTLDKGVADLIGQSIGSLMAEKGLQDIVVGRDGRLSGPDMVEGLVAGLRKAGRNVVDIGMAATPVVYFAAYQLRTGCAIAVTGSHNPPDYNGFKIVVGGETLAGKAIEDLYARIAEDRLYEAHAQGNLQQRDVSQDYIDRIASDVQLDRRLKVVVDAGNGVAGAIAPQVLTAIGADVTPLYCEVDGTFPNHHPDPSEPHNLESLIQMVKRLDADIGVAFDGDGDRLGVVTKDGNNIFPDRLLMLFAADVLERNPGAVIVYDVKCTGRLPGQILRHGGSPLMWKTGHSLIKAKMRETEAELAGEMSGHFFFKERWYGFDDGIYAAARLLEILAARPQTPSEVLDALPDGVSTPEIKVPAPDDDPHAFVDAFKARAKFEGGRLSTIDGLRVDWPDGWGLVRASNTTPVLVLRFDGDSRDALTRIQGAFREQLLALRPDLKLPF